MSDSDMDVSPDLAKFNPMGIPPLGYSQPASSVANPMAAAAVPSSAGRSVLAYAHNPTPTGNVGNDVPSWPYKVDKNVNLDKLSPSFSGKMQKFLSAAKANGVTATVLSGYRDTGLQSKLYANYQAKQAGKPIPFPEEGSGGIAAPPGGSAHEAGMGMDVAGASPKDQQWLIANAPSYGIYPGANFGDPPHFQDASWHGNGGGQAKAMVQPQPQSQPNQGGGYTPTHSGVENNLADMEPGDNGLDNKNLMTLAMLQAMAPLHKFTPVDYDPYKVMPHIEGVGN